MSRDAKPGLLFPDVPACVRWQPPDGVNIANLAEGWSCYVDGVLGSAFAKALDDGTLPPRLVALGQDHPLVRAASRLIDARAVPWTRADALKLTGFDTLFVEVIGTCNEKCIHCYAGSTPMTSAALDRETCEAVVADAVAIGFRCIQFTGGDPLLCPFLPELVAYARHAGIAAIEIFTNGLLLDGTYLDRLAPWQPTFALSLYSSDPKIHDAITRVLGSWHQTTAAIERIVTTGLPIRAAIVVMPENAQTILQTVDFLRSRGVSRVSVSRMHAVGRGDFFSENIARTDTDGQPAAEHGHDDNGSGQGKLCVTYTGAVTPCIFNRRDVLGQLAETPLRDIIRAPARAIPDGRSAETHLQWGRERLQCVSCQLTAYALRHHPLDR